MSKPHSEQIYRLISTMSKSEKRAFTIHANRFRNGNEKKFLLLFEAIEKYGLKNDQDITQKYPSLKPEQLSNLKANLYLQILKCIQAIQASKMTEMRITEMIDHARILYNRCLYKDCLHIVDKARKRAENNGSKLLLLEILELEKLTLRHIVDERIEKRLNHNIDETVSTVESIQNINLFANLSLKLNSFYQKNGFIRNNKDLKRVQHYFFSALPQYEENKLSFYEKMHLYYSFTGYYFFIQHFREGYVYAKKWNQLFIDEPEMIYKTTELYIKSLNSLLVVQNKLLLYDEFMETHRKLVALKRNKKIANTENINLNLFKAIYIHEINRHFLLGEFKSGIRIVSRLENELNNFIPMLDANTVLLFYYKIGCLYFGASNFKSAVKWFNKIINQTETNIREDIQAFARILRLICYFELKEDDMVEYSIRSTYRFLLDKKIFVNYQRLIMNFLRGLKKDYTNNEIVQRFRLLKSQMQELEKDPYEKRAFIYFDMISWLESKIDNRIIQDVVKEKAGQRIKRTVKID